MNNKVKETDKLKYFIDAEFATIKMILGVILYNQVTADWQKIAIIFYVVVCFIYATMRLSYLAAHDKEYLRVPKR